MLIPNMIPIQCRYSVQQDLHAAFPRLPETCFSGHVGGEKPPLHQKLGKFMWVPPDNQINELKSETWYLTPTLYPFICPSVIV